MSNGLDIWYECSGDRSGVPLLLIAGLGLQAISWRELITEAFVDAGFFVVRYDQRDTGLSTKISDGPAPDFQGVMSGDVSSVVYTLDDLAEDASGLLDALDISAAHVVGESMGGMVAQLLAIKHPERVLSLASVSSTTGNPLVGRPAAGGQERLRGPGGSGATTRDAIVEKWVSNRRNTASPGFWFNEDEVRARLERAVDRCYWPLGRARQLLAIMCAWDRTAALGDVKIPSVVIHGTADPLVDVSGGSATADALPDSTLVLIKGMAHEWPEGACPQMTQAIIGNARRAFPTNSTPGA